MAASRTRLSTQSVPHRTASRFVAAAAALTFSAGCAIASSANAVLPVVSGKPVAGSKSFEPLTTLRFEALPATAATVARLRAVGTEKVARMQQENVGQDDKLLQIGIARDAVYDADSAPAKLEWTALPNGAAVARFAVQSPGARALRLGLAVAALPDDAELRVYGSEDPRHTVLLAQGREIRETAQQLGLYWTPVTEGERQGVELYLPGGRSGAVRLRIASASHLFASARDKFAKATATGASESCNEDVACIDSPSQAFLNASRSVTRMLFTKNGTTYLCSGTLVSDGNAASQIPYVHTASHCIDSQAAAGSLNTFWFFEATFCRAKSADNYRQLAAGATLLFSNAATDTALVRLNERAPDGAFFSGWDPNPVATGAALVTVHHPAGDLKKVSAGRTLDYSDGGYSSGSFITVAWLSGSTQGGSSGAGLFTLANNEYLLRGGLRGGSASCASSGNVADSTNRDYFSRLDIDYAGLKSILSGPAAPMDDYTDMWWNPAESGWGLSIIQHPSNQVFATWYTYDTDGRPLWVILANGAWTSTHTFSGTLYRANGPGYNQKFDSSAVALQPVGTATLSFASSAAGSFEYTLNGVHASKAISRFAF